MFRFLKYAGLTLCAVFLFSAIVFAEDITITTYYPSPYGVYDSLQTDKLGVGDNNGDGILSSADVPVTSGDVWIKGNLGIGKRDLVQKLEVIGNCLITGKFQGGISGNYSPISSPGVAGRYNSYTISFGTSFTVPPMVILISQTAGAGGALLVVNIQSVTTSNCIIRVSDNDFGRAGISGSVNWIAIGI